MEYSNYAKYTFNCKSDYEEKFTSFVKELKDYTIGISRHKFIVKCNFIYPRNAEDSVQNKVRATFCINVVHSIPVSTRAYLSNADDYNNTSLRGAVVDVSQFKMCIDFNIKKNFLLNESEYYNIQFESNLTSITRMTNSISNIINSDNNSLVEYLLKPEKKLDVACKNKLFKTPNLPALTQTQVKILYEVMDQKFTVIQGPPGTGKTVTSACIVHNLVKYKKERVLVCAPSNNAADNIARKIQKTNVKVVRLYATSREIDCGLPEIAVHNIIYRENVNLQHMMKKFNNNQLNRQETDFLFLSKRSCAIEILKKMEVVVCTLSTSADVAISDIEYKYVLIDEATQCTEPECIIPLRYCSKFILVGDHKQLGPVITCPSLIKSDFKMSLFERVIRAGVAVTMLDTQFRMHPSISHFPSKCFYQSLVKDGIGVDDRPGNGKFIWISKDKPIMFVNHTCPETACRPSYCNDYETVMVYMVIANLLKAGVDNFNIGVVTPYKSQTESIKQKLECYENMNGIEIDSVDSFQGREKDYMIVSCVRSNKNNMLGFLKDWRRLNVSITRAKYGMIIIGNAKLLSCDSTWNKLIKHYCERKKVVCYNSKKNRLVLDVEYMNQVMDPDIYEIEQLLQKFHL